MNYVKGDKVVHKAYGSGTFQKYYIGFYPSDEEMAQVKFDKPVKLMSVCVKDLEKVEVKP